MKTRGEHIAQAIRDYLGMNNLKASSLNGRIVAEIADRTLAHLEKLDKKKKRLATEDDWIKELEAEPHLEGVNVRKELAACQFWCKNNGPVLCTRKRFVNWLNRAEKARVVSPGGATQPATKVNATPGWLARLNAKFPESVYAKGGLFEVADESAYNFSQLPAEVRKAL